MKSFLTIKALRAALTKKEITPQESIKFFSARLQKYNPSLNAAIELFEPTELPESTSVNQKLLGIPGLIKDNISQKNRITSCGSKILSNYHAPYDATITKRLKTAGATILGRTNMDEFAMGSSGEFSAFGATCNPWSIDRSPGGSSSGSAAAVAAGLVPWAIGTETGGSVRQPASFCGLVGLYPTYGLFSRYGLVAFASSTDQAGPLTRTVYDNAYIASILSGHDAHDSTSIPKPSQDFTKYLTGDLPENITIGVLEEALDGEGIHPAVRSRFEEALKHLRSLGATIKPISLPDLKYGISVYFVLSRAEAASNLARYDGTLYGMRARDVKDLQDMYRKTRGEGFGAEVKRRILMGNYVLSASYKDAFYTKAMQVRALINRELENAFKEVDLLVSPTTPSLPFRLGVESQDPLAMYLADYFTVPNCVTGMPAISIPCGLSGEGLPIGFQFIGPRLSEPLLYQTAYAYEQSTDFHKLIPAGFE